MREAEVLHDFLLEVFNCDASIKPRDILVMTPDIEEYAPFIRAVFDAPGDESRRVPYTIADQTVRRHSTPVKTFFSVLSSGQGPVWRLGVIDILERPAVQRRFRPAARGYGYCAPLDQRNAYLLGE